MRTCVGLDIGRSSVKVVSRSPEGRREILFPSSVCPAFGITDEREQLRALEETVTVNQRDYFFGATAALQGQDDLLAGLRDDWVFTDSHTALFRGALRKLRSPASAASTVPLLLWVFPHHSMHLRKRDFWRNWLGMRQK